MRLFSLLSLLFGSVILVGCGETTSTATTSSTTETSAPILTSVNATCPIMGGDVTPDGGSADFNGKEVGFCCPGCIDEWNELSDEQKSAKLAALDSDHAESHGEHGEHGQGDHDHGDAPAAG